MEPTKKSPEIDAFLKASFGVDRQRSIRANCCVDRPIGCGQRIDGFTDEKSEREYTISGLCQSCQDLIFREEG